MVSRCQRPRAERSLPACHTVAKLAFCCESWKDRQNLATLSRPQHLPHSTFYDPHRSIEWRLTTQFDSIKWTGEVRPCSPCHTASNTACVPPPRGGRHPNPSFVVRLTFRFLCLPKKIETLYTLKKNEQTVLGFMVGSPWCTKRPLLYITFSQSPTCPHPQQTQEVTLHVSLQARALSVSKYKLTLFKMLTICCDSSRVSSR